MLADVTEKVLTHLDENLTVDSFLDKHSMPMSTELA